MADQNLEILIKIATEGGPQAQEVIAQLNQLAAEGSQAAAAALQKISAEQNKSAAESGKLTTAKKDEAGAVKQVTQALAEETRALHKDDEAQRTNAQETGKATTTKKNYTEALKGLALQVPGVAQALRLAASPVALLGAAMSVGVGQVRSMIQAINELAVHIRAFETRNSRIDPMSVIRENMGRDRDGIRQQGGAMDELGRELQKNNLLLGLRMELLGKNADAKMGNELEAIEGKLARGEIKLAEAIRLRAAAQREARESTEIAALDAVQKESANEALTSSRAAFRASKATEAANALTPQIEKQIEKTQKADADVGDVANVNAARRKNLEEQRQWLMEAVSSPGIAKLDFLKFAKSAPTPGCRWLPFKRCGAARVPRRNWAVWSPIWKG